MKNNSASKSKYSEKEMADAFQDLLQSSEGLPHIGVFDGVYREITCRQGRPDFIAMRSKSVNKAVPLPEKTGFVGSLILSLLKQRSPRTLQYLIEKSEYSEKSVKRSLRQLLASGHIDKTESESYILGAASGQFGVEIWSFELKLNNPKRALFQAQQSCAFAECSIIVVPPDQAINYKRYTEAIKRWGIGIATFDPFTHSFSMSKRPRKSRAFSLHHKIYAIAQFYSKTNASFA